MAHLERIVLDGGVSVQIGRMILYPNYNQDAERRLVENLHRALQWRVLVGFVPFFYRLRRREARQQFVVTGSEIIDGRVRVHLREAAPSDIHEQKPRKVAKTEDGQAWEDLNIAAKEAEAKGRLSSSSSGEDDDKESGSDAMDLDEPFHDESAQEPDDADLNALEDLEFIVPALGHGRYRTYTDTTDYQVKVDYLPADEEKEDEAFAWYVYTQEAPYVRLDSDTCKLVAMPSSPVSRLIGPHNALNEFMRADIVATRRATAPPVIAEERPPVKASTTVDAKGRIAPGSLFEGGFGGYPTLTMGTSGAPSGGNSQIVFGKPHLVLSPMQQLGSDDPYHHRQQSQAAQATAVQSDLAHHTYYLAPGYTYGGLYTPHAYPPIAARSATFLDAVSMEFGIPGHVILPGKVTPGAQGSAAGGKGSGGMAGSTAGGKRQQASGAGQSGAGRGGGAAGRPAAGGGGGGGAGAAGSGFTADPSFNKALEMRDFLQDFFQAFMMTKNMSKMLAYHAAEADHLTREAEIKKRLLEELEERIASAQEAVLEFGQELESRGEQQGEVKDAHHHAEVEILERQARDAAAPPPKPTVGADGKPKAPTGPDPPSAVPSMPEVAAPSSGIPTAEEVVLLTQRRLEIENDMNLIMAAQEQRARLASMERPVSIVFRQPFVNDTSQIPGVVSMLGLPDEQAHAIAQRRMGLQS
jgi:hypothetical protein